MSYLRFVVSVLAMNYIFLCAGQNLLERRREVSTTTTPIPFPPCRADDIDCLRRGLRTFFNLMDSGHYGMTPVDPIYINSVAIALPEQQLSFLLRKVIVTGISWTKLVDKRFHENGIKNGVLFSSDLHVTGDLVMAKADIYEPLFAHMTMDIQGVQTNITYSWDVEKKKDNEYYISLGQERIAIRNGRLPTFFLQPRASADTKIIDKTLQLKPSIVDHFSEEITAAAMRTVMDNIRLFAQTVPVKYYYKLF
ncbi:juvenile hormone-binding protein-like [Bombyx mandarina]|uniref:Juvenile hormone-binding protein-like n=1 Tax=Bombyx mandarina TaxID=7092 RepID=A0A6J2JXV8_BOMMA|nr:juvenile hormone-binding protein-like [Bombyx mandarina]